MSGDIAANCIVKGRPDSYPHEIYRNFIKWDTIGKAIIRISSSLDHVGPKAVVSMHRRYLDVWYSLH